jgi:hypothetical protein
MTPLTIKKIVGASAGVILVVASFASGTLENTYVTYPRSPDPQQGRTVPHAVKGITVYITKGDSDLLSRMRWIAIGAGALAGLVILTHRGDPLKSKE